jgi:DNA-directed RNA polymerase subunit E'/Rpb7
MESLFERRQLVRNVHVDAKSLTRNVTAGLLAQLRNKFEGICLPEGYVQRNSITIVDYSLGRANLIKGGVDYQVRFHADICMPHPGQVFRGVVSLKSKIGLHVEVPPMKVLLPRDLHLGNGDFETTNEKQEVEFEVVGSKFQQGDDSIVVLAKLRTLVAPAPVGPPAAEEEAFEPGAGLAAASGAIPKSGGGELKKVTVDLAATKAPEQSTRRKTIRPNGSEKTNES